MAAALLALAAAVLAAAARRRRRAAVYAGTHRGAPEGLAWLAHVARHGASARHRKTGPPRT